MKLLDILRSMIKAILFDLDDTLIKTLETSARIYKLVAKKYYNIVITDEDIKKHWGKPFTVLIDELYQHSETIELLSKNHFFESQNNFIPAYEEVGDVLTLLFQKYKLAIVSSHSKEDMNETIQRAGIDTSLFFYIQSEGVVPYHKPDPRVFEKILKKLKKLNILPSDVVYIGDTLLDYYAARGAGIPFFGIANRTTTQYEFESQGASTIMDLNDLVSKLD